MVMTIVRDRIIDRIKVNSTCDHPYSLNERGQVSLTRCPGRRVGVLPGSYGIFRRQDWLSRGIPQ